MPVSIRTAANYFARDTFSYWNPTADRFDGCFQGRTRRIDDFVSLWHRSTRREHIYIRPDACFEDTGVFKHHQSGEIYLVSETRETDGWQGAGTPYSLMVRAHKLGAPSGGKGLFHAVTTAGSGDNLGPVSLGSGTAVWADVELRTTTQADGSVEMTTAEYLLSYSRNVAAQEGDYFYHKGQWYRVLEPYNDSGYMYCRTNNQSPMFVTATFTTATTSAFNPVTGAFTAGTTTSRQVSVIVGDSEIDGRPSDNDLAEKLTIYIYLHHIGFVPAVGMKLALNSKDYRVIKVAKHYENKQYELEIAP